MLRAHEAAATALGARVSGPLVWGWHGRTLSRRADHPQHGACWLRLLSAPVAKAGGKLWEGNAAAAVFDGRLRKPALHALHELADDDTAYRAELTSYADAPICSPTPVLRTELPQSDIWWKTLQADLATIAATPTDRVAVRQEWITRAVPRYTDLPAPQVTDWTTAHGDLHAANLTTDGTILDWEAWGTAPAGYDCALLLAYSLLEPATTARIRTRFADVLDSAAGRTAQLVVAAELLQSASRGDHPDLIQPLRSLVIAVTR